MVLRMDWITAWLNLDPKTSWKPPISIGCKEKWAPCNCNFHFNRINEFHLSFISARMLWHAQLPWLGQHETSYSSAKIMLHQIQLRCTGWDANLSWRMLRQIGRSHRWKYVSDWNNCIICRSVSSGRHHFGLLRGRQHHANKVWTNGLRSFGSFHSDFYSIFSFSHEILLIFYLWFCSCHLNAFMVIYFHRIFPYKINFMNYYEFWQIFNEI